MVLDVRSKTLTCQEWGSPTMQLHQAAIEIALRFPSGDTPRFARLQRAFQSRQRTNRGVGGLALVKSKAPHNC